VRGQRGDVTKDLIGGRVDRGGRLGKESKAGLCYDHFVDDLRTSYKYGVRET